jgi:hypothetical protein
VHADPRVGPDPRVRASRQPGGLSGRQVPASPRPPSERGLFACRTACAPPGGQATMTLMRDRTSEVRRRFARGSAAALVATFVALFSHMAGGGPTPPFLGVAVPLFFSLVICTILAGLRSSLLRLTVSVGLSQLCFHWVFSAAAVAQAVSGGAVVAGGIAASGDSAGARLSARAHALHSSAGFSGSAGAGAASGHAGHAGAGQSAGADLAGHADLAGAAAHSGHLLHTGASHSGSLMLLAHAAAAVLTIAVLRHAERALASLRDLLRMVGRRLTALASGAVSIPSAPRRRGPVRTRPTRTLVPLGVLRCAHLDRGPPAFAG